MAFLPYSIDDGRVSANEYIPAGAITPAVGMALVVEGGAAAIAAGEDKPQYICVTKNEGEEIAAIRVQDDMIFETTAAAAFTSVKVGDKVNITADGLEVNATTGGAAEVVAIEGTEIGAKIRVRF